MAHNQKNSAKMRSDVIYITSHLLHKTYYHKSGILMVISDKIRKAFLTMCSDNDKFMEFVNDYITITNNPADRIGKQDFMDNFNSVYKSKHEFISILSDLKRCNLEYNRTVRDPLSGSKGCLIGCKFKEDTQDDDKANPLDDVAEFVKEKNKSLPTKCLFIDDEDDLSMDDLLTECHKDDKSLKQSTAQTEKRYNDLSAGIPVEKPDFKKLAREIVINWN